MQVQPVLDRGSLRKGLLSAENRPQEVSSEFFLRGEPVSERSGLVCIQGAELGL